MFRISLGSAMVCALLLGAPAWGAVEYKDVGALTAEARQIVIGDVVEISSFWNESHTLIKSRIVVEVSDYLVGEGSGVEILEMSGGTVDGLTLDVSVLPVFEEGDHVLLFLGESEIRLVQAFQGAYLTDGELVARTAPRCQRVIEESLQPLQELLDEIEAALPPGTVLPEITPYDGGFSLPIGLRYALCGYDWTYKSNPMGEDYKINANCADASAGTAESQRTQIQLAAGAWNGAGADFEFTYGGTSTQTSVNYNGTNLMYFDTTPPDGGGYVAANYIWQTGGNIQENDIVFNDANYGWWNGDGSCVNKMDIRNIATHEMGHSLCLDDLYGGGDSNKTMYGYVSTCEIKKRSLHDDDINGIMAIYGEGCDRPDFITQPEPSQTVCEGGYVSLSVEVDTLFPDYQWRRGTTNLVNDGVHILGATSDTLYIVNITEADEAGDYNCLVTNTLDGCWAVSDNAQIIVDPVPVILEQPQDQTVTEGGYASFSINVESPVLYDFQWRKDTLPLSDNGHISGALTQSLTIVPVEEADEGTYDCVVTGKLGAQCSATSDAATLTVEPGGDDCPEDLTGDEQITLADLSALLANYGQPGMGPDDGDFDGDGDVDISDLSQLLSVYGQDCPTR